MNLAKQAIAWLCFTFAGVNMGALAIFYGMSIFHDVEMKMGVHPWMLLQWVVFSMALLLWHRWKASAD